MEHKITFISTNDKDEKRKFSFTPDELATEYGENCNLPDRCDTIKSCVFAGVNLYFETFGEVVTTFIGW